MQARLSVRDGAMGKQRRDVFVGKLAFVKHCLPSLKAPEEGRNGASRQP